MFVNGWRDEKRRDERRTITPTVGSEGNTKNLIPVSLVRLDWTSPPGTTFSSKEAANFSVTSFLIEAM